MLPFPIRKPQNSAACGTVISLLIFSNRFIQHLFSENVDRSLSLFDSISVWMTTWIIPAIALGELAVTHTDGLIIGLKRDAVTPDSICRLLKSRFSSYSIVRYQRCLSIHTLLTPVRSVITLLGKIPQDSLDRGPYLFLDLLLCPTAVFRSLEQIQDFGQD